MSVLHPSEFALGDYGLVDERFHDPGPASLLPGTRSHLNIRYARPAGWRPLLGDLHLPIDGPGPHPVVVYAHGGSFLVGDKDMEPGPWSSLPRRGIAVFSVDYRLAGEVPHPEPVEDVLAAIRWVRANAARFGLDPERVAAWGSSAGGYLVGRAAYADDRPVGRPVGECHDTSAALSAAVLHYPATDFGSALEDLHESTEESRKGTVDVISRYLGVPMLGEPGLTRTSSVLTAAATAVHRPPLLLQHGTADRRSGAGQSIRLHEALTRLGATSELDLVDGEDHATAAFAAPRVVDVVVDFLRRVWARPA